MINAPFLHKSFGPKKEGKVLLLLPDHSRNVYLISDPTLLSGSWLSIKSKIDAKGIEPIARYQADDHGFYSWEPLSTKRMTALDVANLSSACYKLFKLDHSIDDPFLQKTEVIKEILRFFGEEFVRSIRHSVEPDPTVYALPEAENTTEFPDVVPMDYDLWTKGQLVESLSANGITVKPQANKQAVIALVEQLITA